MLAAECNIPPCRLCTHTHKHSCIHTPTRGASQLWMCEALTDGDTDKLFFFKCHSSGAVLALNLCRMWLTVKDGLQMREGSWFYCKCKTSKLVRQTISLQNGWVEPSGAGLLTCFPSCWGQLQLYRGTSSTHLACLGAGICAGIFFFMYSTEDGCEFIWKTLPQSVCFFFFLRAEKIYKMLQIN